MRAAIIISVLSVYRERPILSPYSLAMGSALGASIAVTPTLPLHTVCIIGITLLLRVSTIAGLMAGTVISNPLTFAAQYYLSWKVGNMILPGRLDWNQRTHRKTEEMPQ